MTSMLCVQEPGGLVEHHHRDISEQVLRDSANHKIFSKYFPDDDTRPRFMARRPFSTPNPAIGTDNFDRTTLMAHSMKLQNWLNDKSVKILQEKSDVEAKPVKDMYKAVLDQEDDFVKGLVNMCSKHDYMSQRKKEVLHKTWSARVHEPIRGAVIQQMDNQAYEQHKRRKDQLYREYIEHCNRKGHVFRDDFDPQEYYPLGLSGTRPYVVAGLQASTARLKDPTRLQDTKRDEELGTELRCTSGTVYRDRSLNTVRLPTLPLAPRGRHGTENHTWINMPLTDIESTVREASRRRMVGTNLRGEIDFGKWSTQTYPKSQGDTEMAIQKRKHCRRPPFNAPNVVELTRKRLPAAKENYNSKTLPLHVAPYGIDPEPSDTPPADLKASTSNIIVGLNVGEDVPTAEPLRSQYMSNYMDPREDWPLSYEDVQGVDIVV